MGIDWTSELADQLDWHWTRDAAYGAWIAGVRGLGPDDLAEPCGPDYGPFADRPLAGLVLHLNREAIHHGAEIALLRDLYLRQRC
jgi:DinB family protein